MFGWKRRHAEAPVSIAMAQAMSISSHIVMDADNKIVSGVLAPPKSPTERHAETLGAALDRLREEKAGVQFDRDMYADLVAHCDAREKELDAIIAALQPAHDKLMDTPRIPLGAPLNDAPDEIQAQLA